MLKLHQRSTHRESADAESSADLSADLSTEAEGGEPSAKVEAEGESVFGEAAAKVEAGADLIGASAEADAGNDTPAEPEGGDLPYTLAGIGEKTVRKLVEAGLGTQDAVATATVEQLSEIPGIGGKTAEKILAAARGNAPAEGSADL